MAQYCYVTSTLITSTMQIFRLIMIFPSQLDSTCERSVWLQGQTIVACRVKVSICLQNCNCLREWREVWALHWLCQWGSWLRRPLYCVRRLSHFSCVWLFATLGTIARQASLTTGFSRQEYWSGLPFPPPRYVPDSTQRTGECQSFSTPQAKLPTSLFKLVFSHRVCVYVCVLAIQLCPTLCNALDCHSSGRYVLKILSARILEWVAITFSRGSSWPRDWTQVSCTAGRFLIVWVTSKAPSHCKTFLC